MGTIEQLAEAAVLRDALAVRSLAQDLLHQHALLSTVPLPLGVDERARIVAAALVELLAQRRNEPPPTWTASLGALDEPFYLVAAALRMPRLRSICEQESPEPLRRRNLFAPPDYLTFA